jgi:hypothetical protein
MEEGFDTALLEHIQHFEAEAVGTEQVNKILGSEAEGMKLGARADICSLHC